MACGTNLISMLNAFEAGSNLYPMFFSDDSCLGRGWPTAGGTLDLKYIGKANVLTSLMCSDSTTANCPIPIIKSMIIPDNVRIKFKANKTAVKHDGSRSVDSIINEYGEIMLDSSSCPETNLIKNTAPSGQSLFKWGHAPEDKECSYTSTASLTQTCPTEGSFPGEPNRLYDNSDTSCLFSPGPYFDDQTTKMSQSIISCKSNFYPSLLGVNMGSFNADHTGNWHLAGLTDVGVHDDSSHTNTDLCAPQGGRSLEGEVFQNYHHLHHAENSQCNKSTNRFQAAACLGGVEAIRQDLKFGPPCGPNLCGSCNAEGTTYNCICQGTNDADWQPTVIHGSISDIQITYHDDDGVEIGWPALEGLLCTKGFEFGGITVQRYNHGSPSCDLVMKTVCSNTASLTDSSLILEACGCILEEKKLKQQFAGIDLPVQCFSSVCSLTNENVYKTNSQIEGCSAKLCQQTLTIQGSGLLASGFQEIVCNGVIYDVGKVQEVEAVTIIDAEDSTIDDSSFGPVFFISIAILVMLVILVLVWGIRKFRTHQALGQQRKLATEQIIRNRLNI